MTRPPHIPGQNARPPEGSIPAGVEQGKRLFAAGYFWEAHEAWEPVWLELEEGSAERALVQGMIQIANARLKIVMGRAKAAARIAEIAAGHLRDAGERDAASWAHREMESLAVEVERICAL